MGQVGRMIVKQTMGIRGHRFCVRCPGGQGSSALQCLLSALMFPAPPNPIPIPTCSVTHPLLVQPNSSPYVEQGRRQGFKVLYMLCVKKKASLALQLFSRLTRIWLILQAGLVKNYGDAEAFTGLLNLVKLELGMSLDTEFTQASCPALP